MNLSRGSDFINILLIFIAGFLFCECLMPLFDGIIGLILQWLECIKTKWALKTAEFGSKIQDLQSPQIEENSRAIGFFATDEEEYEDDDNL